jgi:hypothetical protein
MLNPQGLPPSRFTVNVSIPAQLQSERVYSCNFKLAASCGSYSLSLLVGFIELLRKSCQAMPLKTWTVGMTFDPQYSANWGSHEEKGKTHTVIRTILYAREKTKSCRIMSR